MKQDDILGGVRVASPCKASWERMEGDERVRHCEACSHSVYNLSGMTRSEAEALIVGSEGRLCVRFYRRPDGTMLTQNCPVGIMALRKRMATTLACAGVFFLSLYSYASRLGHSKPVEPQAETGPMSAYQQARQVEALRIVLDRLYPPLTPPISVTLGMIARPVDITTTPTPQKSKH